MTLQFGLVLSVPVQMSDAQTSDATNVGQYKRQTHKRRTSTNVGLVQTSDWYKRRTSTNVGPVQTSDQYKRLTSTNVGLVQTLEQYKCRTGTFIKKTSDLVDFEWTIVLKNFKL